MARRTITTQVTVAWEAHDAWSELYLGLRRLVHEILPANIASQTVEDSALCQLALVGSSSLVEVGAHKLLQTIHPPHVAERRSKREPGLDDMLKELERVTEKQIEWTAEPMKSIDALRQRRNATIHRRSELATVPMAKSSLFTAVEACRYMYSHAGAQFAYESTLKDDPIPIERWFSDVPLPAAT